MKINEFQASFTNQAAQDLEELENNATLKKSLNAVRKALAYLQATLFIKQ